MAVPAQTPSNASAANGVTTVFPYTFLLLDEGDLRVTGTDADGSVTEYALDVDFTVDGIGASGGGNVTFTAAPASGMTIVRRRVMAYKREVDYQNNGDLLAAEMNRDQDGPVMMVQQLAEAVSRALLLPEHLTGIATAGLPAPEALRGLRWNAAGNGIENVELGAYGDASGADLVGFRQSGAGMVLRTLLAKGRDVVHADDRGLLGNGTDETAALQDLLTAAQGKVLMLGAGKTYAYNIATGLTLENVSIVSNGAKFKRLTASSHPLTDSEFNFIIGNDVTADRLEVECVGGAEDIGGVIVTGSRVRIGTFKVSNPTPGSGTGASAVNAVRIGPNAGSAEGIHIGELACSNWDRPVTVQNVTRCTIGYISIENYRRGLYIKDAKHLTVMGGHIRGLSPNSLGVAGDNGVLMESLTAHWSCSDVRINNVTIENAGEHGFRVGGQFNIRNVWATNCHSYAHGSGSAATGACAFKALGATGLFGARHQNIHFIDCSAWDANLAGLAGGSNFAGVQLGKVFGGSVVNFVAGVTPADLASYAESGNSCMNGIEIIGCQKITVTNPQIQRPTNAGIYIYDFTDGVNDWGQTDDISIIGGSTNVPGDAGVEIVCSVITMRRLHIDGHVVNGGNYSMKVAKSGAGAFLNCFARLRSVSPATESFNGCDDWTIQGSGSFTGTNACANGSIYQDASGLRQRRGGAWCPLTGSAVFDPASLIDGSGTTTTVPCVGAALGDRAEATFSNNLNSIMLTAWVSAADTVSVRFQNESGGTLDLLSGTLRVFVDKP